MESEPSTFAAFDTFESEEGRKAHLNGPVAPALVLGTNLVIDQGVPYISYLDFGDNLAHVKKFNGTAWEDVGTNNPADGLQLVIQSLRFNDEHVPFIAFIDAAGGVLQ